MSLTLRYRAANRGRCRSVLARDRVRCARKIYDCYAVDRRSAAQGKRAPTEKLCNS
ncbi:hypothetical protein PSCICL_48140 [Pseudomonas cichorii]|nr:hypothetical protein PSCICL_48140 [Pseudomonas cichorii]